MGRRRLATLLAATLASGMIALPASALSLGEVTDSSSISTVTDAVTDTVTDAVTDTVTDTVTTDVVNELLDAAEPVIEIASTILEETGLDEVVSPDDVIDGADDLLAPLTDSFNEEESAPQDEQDDPAPPRTTPKASTPTRPANDVVTASAPAPDSGTSNSSVRPAPLPGDGSSAPAARTEAPPAAQVAPPAPIAAPRLDTAPATQAPELAVPVSQGASDAWLKVIASLMVLGTAGIWHRGYRTTT